MENQSSPQDEDLQSPPPLLKTNNNDDQVAQSIKKFFIQQIHYGIAGLKTYLIAGPVYLIVQVVTLYLAFTKRTNNALIVFALPMVCSIIVSLIFLYPRRNDPNYVSYVFFHPSRGFIVILILSVLFFIGLVIYVQITQRAFF